MTADSSAAAIADKHDLVASVVCLVRRVSKPFTAVIERYFAPRTVRCFCFFEQPCERAEVAVKAAAEIDNRFVEHVTTFYFNKPVMALTNAGFSIERRWPTISTLRAPTTLPMKPT